MSVRFRVKLKPPPRPKPSLIAALEFIGMDDPNMPPGRVRQALSRIAEYLDDEEGLKKQYESHWSFGGSQALYVAPTKREGMLPFRVILKVVHLQMALVPLGIVVRGAISLGEAVALDEMITGQGVANAQFLRDEVAEMPRVVVDPAMLSAVEANRDLWAPHHNATDELGYLYELLREDTDGLWFVDYLHAGVTEVDEPEDYHKFLHDHKVLVTRKIENSKTLNRHTRAITWLWHYHDLRVNSLKPGFGDDLRIPPSSPLLYRFPASAKAPD